MYDVGDIRGIRAGHCLGTDFDLDFWGFLEMVAGNRLGVEASVCWRIFTANLGMAVLEICHYADVRFGTLFLRIHCPFDSRQFTASDPRGLYSDRPR